MSIRCHKCHRRVHDSFSSRWNHLQRYHLDIFIGTLAGVLFDEQKLELLGQYFGKVLKSKAYGAIGKTH